MMWNRFLQSLNTTKILNVSCFGGKNKVEVEIGILAAAHNIKKMAKAA